MKSTFKDASDVASAACSPAWRSSFEKNLPLFGHRNWLVVADAAYPAQSRQGIETITADDDQQSVIETVLALLQTSRHVRPIIHLDRELDFVDEKDAPGVGLYRDWLNTKLHGLRTSSLPHEEVISKLDLAARTFRVMVIKTNMTIPYTTVFFELDCAYWDGDSEVRLRGAMRG